MSAVLAEPITIEIDADRQFDFWLGEWDCSWTDGDRRCVASNSVYLDLGGTWKALWELEYTRVV